VLTDPHSWLAFLTLALLEIVLGLDNLIFLTVLIARLPAAQRERARLLGLGLALLMRIGLLLCVVWLTHLVQPLFHLAGQAVSARDLILCAGGLFLLGKSVLEMHHALEGAAGAPVQPWRGGLAAAVLQIGLIDLVFSLDSVFTAVGLVRELAVMVGAIVVAILVMLLVSRSLGAFIARHPTIKMLALAFLLLIGFALVAEALHFEIPKGYLYFAMFFAVGVELINTRLRKRLDQRSRR
jgi:predicted tellurium resistance membrane protein TerC